MDSSIDKNETPKTDGNGIIQIVICTDFDDKVDDWHNDKETTLELHEYLGLTLKEYEECLTSPK